MDLKKSLKIYNETNAKITALEFIDYLAEWDSATQAPQGCFENRGKYLGEISAMSYQLRTAKSYVEAVKTLAESDGLDEGLMREVKELHRTNTRLALIPKAEYVAFKKLCVSSERKYFEAKEKSDFSIFRPYLEKSVEYNRKYLKWCETPELKGYDIMLDKFEEGMGTKQYDEFFQVLKTKLVPFVKKVCDAAPKTNLPFTALNYDCDKQKEYARYLSDVMCFDKEYCVMMESEHPFTTGADSTDVRVTVHYYPDNVLSAIFSSLHEMGHGTYERQMDSKLDDTLLGRDVTMGMHESQSRFYENIIGRSEVFWQTHFGKLQELFPEQLKDVTAHDMFLAANYVETSLIRTEADELTYPLHIMVRYELEKRLMSGELEVKDLPQEWNRMYKEYLGVDVPDDKNGVLQDVHWSFGEFGYFPTYALGSAYSCQIYHTMCKELDVDKEIATGSLKGINEWLKQKLHKYGATKSPAQLLESVCGESFDPNYYVNYLIEKYGKIYNID